MKYKVQFNTLENNMTMLDLQYFVKSIEDMNKEMDKNKGKDNFSKCLTYLRDVLNMMFIHEGHVR